ncbi:hypothetical protein LDL59_08445 [Kaistella anthropi]|nr:hypothetical protein [Kaistella anthropi]
MKDPEKSAKAVNLVYTSDQYMDGFTRKMYRNKLAYYQNGMRIKDKETIQRINQLAIPPAWKMFGFAHWKMVIYKLPV